MRRKPEKTTDEIAAMLADETWMSGAECLAHGFADQVTPAVEAMACIQSKRTEEFKKDAGIHPKHDYSATQQCPA